MSATLALPPQPPEPATDAAFPVEVAHDLCRAMVTFADACHAVVTTREGVVLSQRRREGEDAESDRMFLATVLDLELEGHQPATLKVVPRRGCRVSRRVAKVLVARALEQPVPPLFDLPGDPEGADFDLLGRPLAISQRLGEVLALLEARPDHLSDIWEAFGGAADDLAALWVDQDQLWLEHEGERMVGLRVLEFDGEAMIQLEPAREGVKLP